MTRPPVVLAPHDTRGYSTRERRILAERDAIARENDRLWRLLGDTFDAWVDGTKPAGLLYRTINATLGRHTPPTTPVRSLSNAS